MQGWAASEGHGQTGRCGLTLRRVPLAYQGRAFALQSTLKNGLAIIPLLALGAIASKYGVQPILIAAPFVLLALAYVLVQTSIRFAGFAHPSRLEVMSSYWNEPARLDADG